jgi:hypothetical protein
MNTDNILWSESKTKSLMDDVVDELSTTTVNKHVSDDTSSCQICLFCLEGSNTSFYINNPISSTEAAHTDPPFITITIEENTNIESNHQEQQECAQNDDKDVNALVEKSMVKNFGDLFPCDCAVHAHGTCLQQWLDIEQTCPICRTRIEDGTTASLIDGDDDNEIEVPRPRRSARETTTTSCPIRGNIAKPGCCCCIATILAYFLLFSYFTIS